MRRWLRLGAAALEEGKTNLYTKFSEAMDQAEAASETLDVENLGKAAGSDWRAAAHRLDRRHAKRWGLQVSVRVQAEVEGLLAVAERVLERKVFERLLEALAAEDSSTETD